MRRTLGRAADARRPCRRRLWRTGDPGLRPRRAGRPPLPRCAAPARKEIPMSVTTTGQVVGALDHAARLALDARADLDALLAALGGQVALGSRWQGAGGRAFASAYAEWAHQQARVTAKLQWFHDQLVAVERLNVTTDQAQAATIGASGHPAGPSQG